MTEDNKKTTLTEAEVLFCELYVNGGRKFAGQHAACYKEVFGETEKIEIRARHLLMQPHIGDYLRAMCDEQYQTTEKIAVKLQIAETLKAVMDETSNGSYVDKFGVPLSPAPLRAVSVNAAKALMELYHIRQPQSGSSKGTEGNGGITFNVIVPQPPLNNENHEKEVQS